MPYGAKCTLPRKLRNAGVLAPWGSWMPNQLLALRALLSGALYVYGDLLNVGRKTRLNLLLSKLTRRKPWLMTCCYPYQKYLTSL